MSSPPAPASRVYWHRELPPLSDTPTAEHTVEAESERVPYQHDQRESLWGRCHPSLMAAARVRLEQELDRLGGSCVHVIDEDLRPVIDHTRAEYHLKGSFTYVLYLR